MNGYTPTTEHQQAQARRQIVRVELIEAMGDYDEYMKWANQLSVGTHLDPVAYIEAAEAKMEEIENEAAEIIGGALRARMEVHVRQICEPTNDNGVAPQSNQSPMPASVEDELIF